MKLSWGYKLILVYGIFVIGIMWMVFRASSQKVDLVTKDYYEQELVYQSKIDESARAAKLTSGVLCKQENNQIRIQFPPEMASSKLDALVLLYCPSDNAKDITRSYTTTNGEILFALPTTHKGAFEVKLNWKQNGESYYNEQKIFIQ
ncbi:MAG TPA: FixH family protein [Ferruginibacter sp.]|nr:FixH family protein [Ferruginibacter sp.]